MSGGILDRVGASADKDKMAIAVFVRSMLDTNGPDVVPSLLRTIPELDEPIQQEVFNILVGFCDISPSNRCSSLVAGFPAQAQYNNPDSGGVMAKRDPRAAGWVLKSLPSEGRIGKNLQIEVPKDSLSIGSALRAVVKIVVRMSDGRTVKGSGVLIDPLIIASAGHLFRDDDCNAEEVVIYVGLGDNRCVESRHGTHVVVHHKWYSGGIRANDLAFVRIDKPFETATHLTYMQTPSTGPLLVGVYGFPYDLPFSQPGCWPCYSMSLVCYDSSSSIDMLEHEGDTTDGNSGGPLLNPDGVVIALHRGCYKQSGVVVCNFAVLIDRHGNDFSYFCLVLDEMARTEIHGVVTYQ
ncbi:trypsin-like cysteine/serine peptidase domain-containing protein [Nemania sp. FL0916]|nr:trypsin-like cysteine/serine peptidase domain-containing protein [Nemania sp. FL0916]